MTNLRDFLNDDIQLFIKEQDLLISPDAIDELNNTLMETIKIFMTRQIGWDE